METPTPSSTTSPIGQTLLSWSAPTQLKHEHAKGWYIVAAMISLILLFYSLWTESWSFTMVIIVAIAVYLFVHKAEPEDVTMALGEKGFLFGDRPIAWGECKNYWLIKTAHYSELHISRTSEREREVVILTGPVNILELRNVLNRYLPEIPNQHEKILDTILRICKL